MSMWTRCPSVNNRNRRQSECNICKARRAVLAKRFSPSPWCVKQIICADLMLGQTEAQPDGRWHKMELFSTLEMNLIIVYWFHLHSWVYATYWSISSNKRSPSGFWKTDFILAGAQAVLDQPLLSSFIGSKCPDEIAKLLQLDFSSSSCPKRTDRQTHKCRSTWRGKKTNP